MEEHVIVNVIAVENTCFIKDKTQYKLKIIQLEELKRTLEMFEKDPE